MRQESGRPVEARKKRARWVITALAAGLCLRMFFVRKHPKIDGDALVYGEIAKNWLQHRVYGLNAEAAPRPTLIRLPGYPLFLSICFTIFGVDNYKAVLRVQCFADVATCILVSKIAKSFSGESEKVGLITLWLAALCPFTANYTAKPLTETLRLFCVALAFFGLLRWSKKLGHNEAPILDETRSLFPPNSRNIWLLIIAVSLAYAILLRPDGGLLAVVVIPTMVWTIWRRGMGGLRSCKSVAICGALTLLPLIPWAVRNKRTFNIFQPLAPRSAKDPGEMVSYGFQRWYRTWAIDYASTQFVYWRYEECRLKIKDIPRRAFDSEEQYQKTEKLFNDYNAVLKSTPAIDDRFAKLARERIAANRLRYLLFLPVARVANMWLRPRIELFHLRSQWWKYGEHPSETVIATLYGILNLGYITLALFGLKRALRFSGNLAGLSALVSFVGLRNLLLTTIDNSEPRYVLECFPLVIALAGVSFTGGNEDLGSVRAVLM